MDGYIQKIHIDKVFHLKNFDIEVGNERKHLLITGKNGSGKTILVEAITRELQNLILGKKGSFSSDFSDDFDAASGVDITFSSDEWIKKYKAGRYLIAYYGDSRKAAFKDISTPEKPDLSPVQDVKVSKVDQFINFLVDYKVQAALAKSEGHENDAAEIGKWFDSFEKLLRRLFDDKKLELDFRYKDYSFLVRSEGKEFKLSQLSTGYAAALDIIADMILKMQAGDHLVKAYELPGIVIIDEIETHLHLQLQKEILPLLTELFPNIQFIITTHSPFVLSSSEEAVAYDLENRKAIGDLTDYSYESLTEGYFKVKSTSDVLQERLERFAKLVGKQNPTKKDIGEVNKLMADFNLLPEMISPEVKGAFLQLKRQWTARGILL